MSLHTRGLLRAPEALTSDPLSVASVGQDAIKKSSKDDLPDFYNIVLERPRDDPTGYDCLFIDAASKVSSLFRSNRLAV